MGGNVMVPGTAGFLLQHHGKGLRHHKTCYSSARAPGDISTHSFPHTATHAAADTTIHSSSSFRSSGPIQLRSGFGKHLGSRQEGVVLPSPPSRMPSHCGAIDPHLATSHADCATRPGRPI